ncbi:cathepsin L-like proteinase [Diabrotica undecimpunctata]|uniref:cathepsin L-like proteinase n=1 Tax=Diabrotica undecimpunctata TaxID=50387 RepID=UPI003B635A1E
MKVIVFITCLIVEITAKLDDYEQWISFKDQYSRHYGHEENKLRFQIFQNSLREIEDHNAKYERGEVEWFKGITPFADRTEEEFHSLYHGQDSTKLLFKDSLGIYQADPNQKLPASVDWRKEGAVLPVRSQEDSKACWIFSSLGSVEGQIAIHKKQRIPLSIQNIIDCHPKGHLGGYKEYAYQFIKDHGISSEADYPFVVKKGTCKKDVPKVITTISGHKLIKSTENDLISAIANIGPVGVSISTKNWGLYNGGVFNNTGCIDGVIDHGVLAVGYTEDYIIIKNSWGAGWGDKGYMKIARGRNMCKINQNAMYPIL